MAAPVSGIFWLPFCTVGGSGDTSSIFIYSLWFKHLWRLSLYSTQILWQSELFLHWASWWVWAVVGCEGRWEKFESKCRKCHKIHNYEGSGSASVQRHTPKPPVAQPIIMIVTVQLQLVKYTTPQRTLDALWKWSFYFWMVFQSSCWNNFRLWEIIFLFLNKNLDTFKDLTNLSLNWGEKWGIFKCHVLFGNS